jgi:hypothetical protein
MKETDMNMKVLGLLAALSPLLVTGSYLLEQPASTSKFTISFGNLKVQNSDTPQLPTTWMQASTTGQTNGSDCNPFCRDPGAQ